MPSAELHGVSCPKPKHPRQSRLAFSSISRLVDIL